LIIAREGAKVVVADVNVEGGAETVRLLNAAGGEAVFVQTDVARAAEVETLVRKRLRPTAGWTAPLTTPVLKASSSRPWNTLRRTATGCSLSTSKGYGCA